MKITTSLIASLCIVAFTSVNSIKLIDNPLMRQESGNFINSNKIANPAHSSAPFDRQSAIELAKDLIFEAIPTPDALKRQNIDTCFQQLAANQQAENDQLKDFFEECRNISHDANTQFKPTMFKPILTSFSHYKVGETPCDKEMFPFKASGYNFTNINNSLNKVFEGFNNMSNVNSWVKVDMHTTFENRERLPGNTFTLINEISRQGNGN